MLFNSSAVGVEHYRVRYTDDNKLTVDDDSFFENLTKLVEVGDYSLINTLLAYYIIIIICKYNLLNTRIYCTLIVMLMIRKYKKEKYQSLVGRRCLFEVSGKSNTYG